MGAQNQNAIGLPANVEPSSCPPPTNGTLNCSALGVATAPVVSVFAGTPVVDGPLGIAPAGAVTAVAALGGASFDPQAASVRAANTVAVRARASTFPCCHARFLPVVQAERVPRMFTNVSR